MNKSNLRALLTPIVLALAIVFGMMLNRFGLKCRRPRKCFCL